MAEGSITSANAVIMLAIAGVYPIPQQLQRFSADNIFGTDPQTVAETSMGIDGHLSGGFIYSSITQGFTLQADSRSGLIFDNWNAAQKSLGELYRAQGVILLTSIGQKYQMNNGILKVYQPIPDGGKVLQPRKFSIEWESIDPAAA